MPTRFAPKPHGGSAAHDRIDEPLLAYLRSVPCEVEEQIESITDDFDGEDVLHERVRANFDEAKSILIDLARASAEVHWTVRAARAQRRTPRDGAAHRR